MQEKVAILENGPGTLNQTLLQLGLMNLQLYSSLLLQCDLPTQKRAELKNTPRKNGENLDLCRIVRLEAMDEGVDH
eukprot:4372702-Amphidinium_carterae.2